MAIRARADILIAALDIDAIHGYGKNYYFSVSGYRAILIVNLDRIIYMMKNKLNYNIYLETV